MLSQYNLNQQEPIWVIDPYTGRQYDLRPLFAYMHVELLRDTTTIADYLEDAADSLPEILDPEIDGGALRNFQSIHWTLTNMKKMFRSIESREEPLEGEQPVPSDAYEKLLGMIDRLSQEVDDFKKKKLEAREPELEEEPKQVNSELLSS